MITVLERFLFPQANSFFTDRMVDSKRGWLICHMFFGISMNQQSNLLSHLGSALFNSRFGNS
jgi:hypothetical protein